MVLKSDVGVTWIYYENCLQYKNIKNKPIDERKGLHKHRTNYPNRNTVEAYGHIEATTFGWFSLSLIEIRALISEGKSALIEFLKK